MGWAHSVQGIAPTRLAAIGVRSAGSPASTVPAWVKASSAVMVSEPPPPGTATRPATAGPNSEPPSCIPGPVTRFRPRRPNQPSARRLPARPGTVGVLGICGGLQTDPWISGPGRAVPGPRSGRWLVLLVSSCGAGVREDLAEVVDEVLRRTAPSEPEVCGGQQRPVLRVAAEIGGRTWQVVAEPPHAAAVAVLVWDTVLECAEEWVEGGRRALVRGRDQGAASTGRPVAGVELDSWQVSLEGHTRVVDAVPGPGARAGEQG